MRALSLAAGLCAGALAVAGPIAAPAAAQSPARPDTADLDDGPDGDRDYTIRRVFPGVRAGDPEIFRFETRVERRSVVGLVPGDAGPDGLRVDRVSPDGPAARAGIAAGDRLVAINGVSLRLDRGDADDPLLAQVPARRLTRTVGRLAPGSEVELRYLRDGRERAARVRTVAPRTLADADPRDRARGEARVRPFREYGPGLAPLPRMEYFRPDDSTAGAWRRRLRAYSDSARRQAADRPALGLTLGGTGSARDTLGLFVSAVAAGGPAERAGVVEGDRVAALNGVDLRVPREERDAPEAADARRARFTRELARVRPGDRVTLRLWGDGRWRTVTATTARAGEVYRGPTVFGFGDGAPFLRNVRGRGPRVVAPRLGPDGDVLRLAPPAALPPDGFPEIRELRRELRELRGLRAPVAPRPPLPPLPPVRLRGPGRIVVI